MTRRKDVVVQIAGHAPSSSASATHSACPSENNTPPPATITGKRASASNLPPPPGLPRRPGRDARRGSNRHVDLAEIVARNVQLRRAALGHGVVKALAVNSAMRSARFTRLVLGDAREDRQLLGFLEAAQAHAGRCSGVIATTGLCAQ